MIELQLFAVAEKPGEIAPAMWGWRAVAERTGQELFRARSWWPSPMGAFIDGDRRCRTAVEALHREVGR